IVLIKGESGIGKTCLAMAAARRLTTLGAEVIAASCLPLGASVDGVQSGLTNDAPFHPFANLLRHIADDCLELGANQTAHLLGPRAWVLADCEPALSTLPGVDTFPKPDELTARAARDRLRTALADTVAALADDVPLLVVLLDDLQ